jgi:outer membrane protein assembly factor BamB
MKTEFGLVSLFVCFIPVQSLDAFNDPPQAILPNLDTRLIGQQPQRLDSQRQIAADALKARIRSVRIELDEVTSSPKWIHADGFLSRPDFGAVPPPGGAGALPLLLSQPDIYRPIKRFLDENFNLFGHGSEVLSSARIARDFVTPHNGMRTVVWEQQLDEIPVFEAVLIGHITRRGELVCLSSQFLPNLEQSSHRDVVFRLQMAHEPPVSPEKAISVSARSLGFQLPAEALMPLAEGPKGATLSQVFEAKPLLTQAHVELVWLPTDRNNLILCWRVRISCENLVGVYEIVLSAETGELAIRRCLTWFISDASYRVFTRESPSPFLPGWSSPNTNQPSDTNRILVTTSALSTNASPNGWINDGTNASIGNNVDARRYWSGSDPVPSYGQGQNTVGTSFRVFDYNLNLSNDPTNGYNPDSAVVNLFYWCNWMHDKLYDLGFTEAAGNFQYTNFNRGGNQGDPILAHAQFGRFYDPPILNNSKFEPRNDGTSPWMCMYIFDGPDPDRDAALEAQIILHEYTHGLSTRWITGIGEYGQPRGLGEGWSDFYALALLADPEADIDGCYPMGAYTEYNFGGTNNFFDNYYYGCRRYPYSTDLTKNPLTYKDIERDDANLHPDVPRNPHLTYQPWTNEHRLGEVWCVALWEARANLIAKIDGTNGNQIMLQLTTDGMRLTPPIPTFLQARDGILLADKINNGGTNASELWNAFAKRGMGYSAISPSHRVLGVMEAFDLPPSLTNVWSWVFQTSGSVTSSPAIGRDGTIYIGSSDCKLYAINPDGTLKWQFSSSNENGRFSSSPAISVDESIYIGCDDYNLYAINADGTLKWKRDLGGQVFSSPAIGSDQTIYVGSANNRMHAYDTNGDAKTGWPYVTGGSVFASPAIGTNGTIYVGCMDQYFYAIHPDGTLYWRTNLGGAIFSSPAVGTNAIVTGCDNGKVYGIDSSGTVIWSSDTGSMVRSSPAFDDNMWYFYIGNQNGNFYRLNSTDGHIYTNFTASGAILASPVRGYDHSTFVCTLDGKLYNLFGLGLTNIWTHTNLGCIVSSPVLGENGMLYFGSVNSNVYALHVPTIVARHAWPLLRGNLRHTGNASSILLRPVSMSPSNIAFEISGVNGQSYVYERSTDLTSWNSVGTNATDCESGTVIITNDCSNCFFRVKSLDGTVLSLNALGHINIDLQTNYTMVANQLNYTGGNMVANLLAEVPDYSTVYKWNDNDQDYDASNTYYLGCWDEPNMTFNPGEGIIFQNLASDVLQLSFFGEVPQGYLIQTIPTQWSIRSSIVPQKGRLDTTLGFPILNGDRILRMTGPEPTYTTYTFTNGAWLVPPGPPTNEIGESFWIDTATNRSWSRTFSVW